LRRALADSCLKFVLFVAIAATLLVLALDVVSDLILQHFFSMSTAIALQSVVALVGALLFTWSILRVLRNTRNSLARQNEELASLHTAWLAINLDLKLDIVLQRVADEARRITGARYSALMTLNVSVGSKLFFPSGIDEATRSKIGDFPRGEGVLGLALAEQRAFRLDNIADHPASIGFPDHHPPMNTLLTVPVGAASEIYGQLYLADKLSNEAFDDADQLTVERFAALAALAIKNAEQLKTIETLAIVSERNRVARELHDSIAQVFGYVHAKSQATSEFVRNGDSLAALEHLNDIRDVSGDAFDDVRDQIAGLRITGADQDLRATLNDYLHYWSKRTGIHSTIDFTDSAPSLPTEARVQIFRIVQEALANVDKHARAEKVRVRATSNESEFILDIDDDGVGLDTMNQDTSSATTFGIAIMRERATAIHSELELGQSEDGGTRVRIRTQLTGASNTVGLK
jgi:nitrate/nitrite-specific signal transduction histidine kinase